MLISAVMECEKWAKNLIAWIAQIKKIKAINKRSEQNPQNNLVAFQSILPSKLPASYINFLKQNPSYPILQYACDVYSVSEFSQKLYNFVIHTFFNINTPPQYNLYCNWIRYKNLLNSRYLPIACDAFGNIMVMDLHNYQIYFLELDCQNPQRGFHLYFVAGSFEEFLRQIYRNRNFN